MSEDMRTAGTFMQSVYAMKKALDTEGLEKNLDLEIAARHNVRRKIRMLNAMKMLYKYLHGNGPKPKNLPSVAFDPFEGVDRTNLHYLFKAMMAFPPWELQTDLLILPTALTLLMLEVAGKLFPNPKVFQLLLLVEEFVNRWTLPKLRPEWDERELARQIDKYKSDMEDFEKRFKQSYAELSVYFGSLEEPDKDPTEKKICETHKNAKAVAEKVCGKKPTASFVAQKKALAIWEEYKGSPEVKTKYCKKDHHITYSDVFDYCKRGVTALGFKTSSAFEKAVKAARKRQSRLGKETREP